MSEEKVKKQLADIMAEKGLMDENVDDFYKNLKDKLWLNKKRSSMGVCVICDDCGGSSRSFCSCAKAKYVPTIEELTKCM